MLQQTMPPGGQRSFPQRKPILPGTYSGMQNQNPQGAEMSPLLGAPKPGGSIGGPAPMSFGSHDQNMASNGTMPPTPMFQNAAAQGGSIGGPMSATSSGTRNMFSNPTGNQLTPMQDRLRAPSAMPNQTMPTTPPSGTINTSNNPAWGSQQGVSPISATSGATGIGDFQRFADNAYDDSVRRLDPQFAEQTRGFEQDMVNRGIAPGTPAYDNARRNFEQARTDAYDTARTSADQLGLMAQNQSFNQGATNSGLLNQLLMGQMGLQGAQLNANASMSNAQTAAGSARDRLNYDMQQGDFSNLMQMLGFGAGVTGQNNNAAGQNNNAWNQTYNQNTGMLGQGGQYGSPSQIDVTGPYNSQYNAGLNTAQYNQNQQNANNQMYAQMFAAMMCDRNIKDEIGTADPEEALTAITSIPYVCWSYKQDRVPHVGTYAQDFNKALGLPDDTKINVIDLCGALIGSVQALTARVKELEAA